ncbi:hypothetical protein [Streptomyces sp. NPDC002520]
MTDQGDYALAIRCALLSGDRPLTLSVDGQEIRTDSLRLPRTSSVLLRLHVGTREGCR